MDRKPLREFTHKADSFLSISNSNYKQWVFRYTFLELEKDLGTKGDITTNSIFKSNKIVTSHVLAKQDGIFAGVEEVKYFLIDADPNFRPSIKNEFKVVFKVLNGYNCPVKISGSVVITLDVVGIQQENITALFSTS